MDDPMMAKDTSLLVPTMYQVRSFIEENGDTYTLILTPREGKIPDFFPGQFNMLYLYGIGEIAISIAGADLEKQELLHTIRAVGAVTEKMQTLQKGDEVGVRGPFGSHWPLDKTNCDVLVVAGGVGLASLRSTLFYLTRNRDQYKKVTLLYGARTPMDRIYVDDLEKWKDQGIEVDVSVDEADSSWQGPVGVVTSLIAKHVTTPENTLSMLCGPEVMLHAAVDELMKTQVNKGNIYLSMERNMECAVGFCGHCLYGPYFLCKDGPVFSYERIEKWFKIKEL